MRDCKLTETIMNYGLKLSTNVKLKNEFKNVIIIKKKKIKEVMSKIKYCRYVSSKFPNPNIL